MLILTLPPGQTDNEEKKKGGKKSEVEVKVKLNKAKLPLNFIIPDV